MPGNPGYESTYRRRAALLEVFEDLQGNVAAPVATRAAREELIRRRPTSEKIYGALVYQDVMRMVKLGCLTKVEARRGGGVAHTFVTTGVPLPEVWAGHPAGRVETPVATQDDVISDELGNHRPYRKCLFCKDRFRGLASEHWCSPACGELLQVAEELMVRIVGLESEGLAVLLDVDLQEARRFVVVTTSRGRWETNARKNETWEKLVDRAVT